MYYFDKQNILIEIKEVIVKEQLLFLVGDEIFSNIPDKYLKTAFIPVNWNRALKFLTKIDKDLQCEIIRTGYMPLEIHIYLDFINKTTALLTQDNFFYQIIEKPLFKNQFMKQVFDFKNRNKISYRNYNITTEIIDKYFLENSSQIFQKKI
ncbi:hypothetical protein EELLY_v1c05970 [Entomoplasma ellychniae]|uniref:Uncharacterized protein n=1 Tax=Entomoplasma ellychniae TaxID=2114 RepID=A0A8E2QWD9_9MOLU|nr:hypothetical protein [Entomoplasma ellychniae]PPE04911.1 hypothetical protein EELLY_v1c05970 [Entomoplasma ellychniae]